MHPNARRPLHRFLATIALTAALAAQGTPIGFEETYALSPDRAKAVATLIPGTNEFYYWHCRERLDARDFATVRTVLATWIQRHGHTAQVVEIENREALLSHGNDAARSFQFVRDRLGVTFDHKPVVPGATSDLPTRLDPRLVSPSVLTQRALAQNPGTVDGFTDAALPGLLATSLDADTLHSLLGRLQRPDVDNLPAAIVRDLGHPASQGFGSFTIHGLLLLPQLEECVRLRSTCLPAW